MRHDINNVLLQWVDNNIVDNNYYSQLTGG